MISFLMCIFKLSIKFMRGSEWIDTTYFGLDNFQVSYLGEAPPTTTLSSSTADSKTSSEDTPQNVQVVSHHQTTNIILGIFLPMIVVSLLGLGYFYWKRSRKIIRLLKATQQQGGVVSQPPIKYSRETSQVFVDSKEKRQSKSHDRQSIVDDFLED